MTLATTAKPKILFAGGGTGGHLYSGIAIAREAERLCPGVQIVFVGTERGIEARVLPREGYRLVTVRVTGIKGRGLVRSLAGIFRVPAALLSSVSLLRREKPGAVVGIGGYASGPTVMAAALTGYATAIVEQNVIPGFTNRVLARFVRRIYAPMKEAIDRFPAKHKVVVTGNPIRRKVVDEAAAATARAPDGGPLRMLVFGGSLGARRINQAMIAALPLLREIRGGVTVVHQTGEAEYESVKAAYEKAAFAADVRPFLHDMGAQYAAADLVLCRAGASTLSEILAIGKPAILVPFPHAIYDHQALNARALEAQGAARWIADADLTGERLAAAVASLANDPEARARLAANAKKLGRPEAATDIAREVLSMAGAAPAAAGEGRAA